MPPGVSHGRSGICIGITIQAAVGAGMVCADIHALGAATAGALRFVLGDGQGTSKEAGKPLAVDTACRAHTAGFRQVFFCARTDIKALLPRNGGKP